MAKTCKHTDCSYPVFGKGYCKSHQYLRDDYKPYRYNKEKTGEMDLFLEIWNERNHVSELSGKSVERYYNTSFFPNLFMHILAKGNPRYSHLRMNKDNILIVTPEEHALYDHSSFEKREQYASENNCDWSIVYNKAEKLKAI